MSRVLAGSWRPLLFCGAIGVVVLVVVQGAFLLLSKAATALPVHDPSNPGNQRALKVYSQLEQKPVTISPADVTRVDLRPNGVIQTMDPFHQIFQMRGSHWFQAIGIGILVVLVVALALRVLPATKRIASSRTATWALVVWANVSAGMAVLVYNSRAARGIWDEIYVFATEARHFSVTGIAAVPVTGGSGLAESSADLGMTIVAGVFLRLIPAMTAETALIFAIITMTVALSIACSVALRRWFSTNLWVTILVPVVLVIALPQGLLSTETAMPTGVAAAAFAFFALVLLNAIQSGRLLALAIYSIPLSVIRWEYGIVAAGSALVVFVVLQLRQRRASFTKRILWPLLAVPPLVFLAGTIYREIAFGTWGPEGALSKSMGLDGAYLSSGLRYLYDTGWTNLWALMLGLAIAAVLVVNGFRASREYLIVVLVVLIPLGNSILAGGDWFPPIWERYVISSYVAILMVTVVALAAQTVSVTEQERGKTGIAARPVSRLTPFARHGIPLLLIGCYVLTQLPTVPVEVSDFTTPIIEARTNCLARAGLVLKRLVPTLEGVASAEVNTVAYYAQAPVTDLIGLIDRRVGQADPSPMTAGNLLHRKSNPEVIYADRPAAIYLYEGAACPGEDLSPIVDSDQWNTLINQEITYFRVGSVTKLLAEYRPVSIKVDGEILLHVLIRRDLQLPASISSDG